MNWTTSSVVLRSASLTIIRAEQAVLQHCLSSDESKTSQLGLVSLFLSMMEDDLSKLNLLYSVSGAASTQLLAANIALAKSMLSVLTFSIIEFFKSFISYGFLES